MERTTRKRAPARGWRQWKPEEARRALAALHKSGLPLATFAWQHGYSGSRLRWWRKRLGGQVGSTEPARWLVPAVVTGLPTASDAVVTVRACGEVVVEIANVTVVPATWVAELVSGVSRPTR